MSVYSISVFIHVLFAGIFAGAFIILTVQHRASLTSDTAARKVQVPMLLTIAQQATRIGTSLILLFGVLLLLQRPGMLAGLHLKITIGIIAVALSHMAAANIRRLASALDAEADTSSIDGKLSWSLPVTLLLIIVTIFIGVTRAHL